ncbi:hypothetical protein [Pseudaestuariivita sp.]|uniref:hypothetical protein n=1 Tax=Pseudaestuariivita sp. TaxID=2211669 RepID=UPI004058483A
MTTIITRLYPDTASADQVAASLSDAGVRQADMDVIAPSDTARAEMAAARVADDKADAYNDHLSGSRRLVVVRAPFNPIGIARRAMGIVDGTSSLDVGLASEDQYIAETADHDLFNSTSILKDHPLMLSSDMARPGWSQRKGLQSAKFGMRMLSKRKKKTSASSKGGNNFPGKKIIRSSKHSVIEGGGHPFSNALGIPLLSYKVSSIPGDKTIQGTITKPNVS